MPITLTCAGCGQTFRLKDEMTGRKVRCPECESIQVVPTILDNLPEALSEPASAAEYSHPAGRAAAGQHAEDSLARFSRNFTLFDRYVLQPGSLIDHMIDPPLGESRLQAFCLTTGEHHLTGREPRRFGIFRRIRARRRTDVDQE